MAKMLSISLLFLMAASASGQSLGWWQCSVTHTAYYSLPETWICSLSENCCLTGSRLSTTGCCKELKYESVFSPVTGYKTCTPTHAQRFYCPGNRDCCTVARSGGTNETGCCVSQTAQDTPVTGSPAAAFSPGVEEEEKYSKQSNNKNSRQGSTLHRRLSTGTILVIALIPLVVIVIFIVTAAYYCQLKKSREQRRVRGLRRAQLQAAALGFHSDSDNTVAYEASGIAPPSYWETVDENICSPPPPVPVVRSLGEHRRPPTGNIQYTRLENQE